MKIIPVAIIYNPKNGIRFTWLLAVQWRFKGIARQMHGISRKDLWFETTTIGDVRVFGILACPRISSFAPANHKIPGDHIVRAMIKGMFLLNRIIMRIMEREIQNIDHTAIPKCLKNEPMKRNFFIL